MKRDDDFLRNLLLEIEEQEDWLVIGENTLKQTKEQRKRGYHLELACDAGLLVEVNDAVYRMTNQGHDYLQVIRNEGIWSRTKQAVAETGGSVPLEVLKALATGFIKQKISKHTGIEL